MINNKSVQNPYELSFLMKQQLQKKILTIVFFIVFTVLAIIFTKTFFLFSFTPQSNTVFSVNEYSDKVFIFPFSNLSNTILPSSIKMRYGDLVLVNNKKITKLPFFKKSIKNIVSFFTLNKIELFSEHPTALSNASLLRVIAVPGDSIYLKDFVLYIKNENTSFYLTEFEVSKKNYEIIKPSYSETQNPLFSALSDMGEITLGEGEYFLLSDNRLANLDSRLWGPVNEKNIKGRALFRIEYFKKAAFL